MRGTLLAEIRPASIVSQSTDPYAPHVHADPGPESSTQLPVRTVLQLRRAREGAAVLHLSFFLLSSCPLLIHVVVLVFVPSLVIVTAYIYFSNGSAYVHGIVTAHREPDGRSSKDTTLEPAHDVTRQCPAHRIMDQEDAFVTSQPKIYRPIPRRNFSTQSHSSDSPDLLPQDTPPHALNDSDRRASDFLAQLNARLLRTKRATSNASLSTYDGGNEDGNGTLRSRNKSFLNMTSSALSGIFDDAGASTTGERSVVDTPWGTGAETPALFGGPLEMVNGFETVNGHESGSVGSPDGGLRATEFARAGHPSYQIRMRVRPTQVAQKNATQRAVVIVGKLSLMFLFGVAYGVIVSHLHDSRELAAVQVGGVDQSSWLYLTGWGCAGLVLGSLLPYIDLLSGKEQEQEQEQTSQPSADPGSELSFGEQFNDVVRSVGTFMGIAFAIVSTFNRWKTQVPKKKLLTCPKRRLPWQSTLQLTLTLALVNPALWYILDRSRNGLSFSLITTSVLTSCIFLSNPDVLPSPALPYTANATHPPSSASGRIQPYQQELFAGLVSYDNLATATWVGSVVFCSCICFGGIGRRLAVLDEWGAKEYRS